VTWNLLAVKVGPLNAHGVCTVSLQAAVHPLMGPHTTTRVLYMNLESIRQRGRPRNKWQDEVREDGRIVGGEEWQEKVYNREEWKKLLRTAKNCRILHVPME
jgi:hypothetical protein